MSNIVTTKMFGQQLNLGHWSTDGLVFLWRGIPAGNAIDESFHRNHGTITGPTWVGDGLSFNGTTDYVANTSFLRPPHITIIANIFCTNVAANERSIVGGDDGSGGGEKIRSWQFRLDQTTGALKVLIFVGGSFMAVGGTENLLNSRRNVAMTYDGNIVKIYTDGIFISSNATLSGDMNSSNTGFAISRQSPTVNDSQFAGIISDVKIYNRALSASEIQQLYINPDLPMQQQYPVWMGQVPVAAGLAGIYYRTLLQGVS